MQTREWGMLPCDAPEVHMVSSGNVLSPELLIYYSPKVELLSIKYYPSQHPPVMFNTVDKVDLCVTVN